MSGCWEIILVDNSNDLLPKHYSHRHPNTGHKSQLVQNREIPPDYDVFIFCTGLIKASHSPKPNSHLTWSYASKFLQFWSSSFYKKMKIWFLQYGVLLSKCRWVFRLWGSENPSPSTSTCGLECANKLNKHAILVSFSELQPLWIFRVVFLFNQITKRIQNGSHGITGYCAKFLSQKPRIRSVFGGTVGGSVCSVMQNDWL